MDNYRKFVEEAATGGSRSSVIRNRSTEHASIILESLFKLATSDFCILTGALDPEVYATAEVIAASRSFLERAPDARIAILAETHVDASSHPWLRALNSARLLDRVTMDYVPPAIAGKYKCHFSVADGSHFRLEPDKGTVEAIVQFRDNKLAPKLKATFEKISTLSDSHHSKVVFDDEHADRN